MFHPSIIVLIWYCHLLGICQLIVMVVIPTLSLDKVSLKVVAK